MADFSKWGISPDDVGGSQPTQAVSEPDFNTKWGLVAENPAPVELPPPPAKGAMEGTIIGKVAHYLTSAGNALKSTPENPVTTGEMVEPAGGLAGLIATGPMPGVVRAGESSLPFINSLAKSLRPQVRPLIDPVAADLAAKAIDKYGIPLHGGQISENRTVNYLDNMLNNNRYGEQRSAFNRAITKTFGQDADKLTPDVMQAAQKDLGEKFDTVAANTNAKLDAPLISAFNKINDETAFLQPSERSVLSRHINHVIDIAGKNNGEISGETLQSLFRRGSPLDLATRDSNSNIRHYAGQIKDELLDTMGRYAPDDMKQLYTQAKYHYKNMKTVEDLAEKAPTGDISPPLLMNAVRKSYSDMAYGGGGDLADLARIGQRFLKEPPQSGTQPRLAASSLLGLGGLGGAGAEYAFHDPVMAAKIAGVTLAAAVGKKASSSAVGSVLRSEGYTNRLINSAIPERSAYTNILDKLVNSKVPYLPRPVLPFLQTSQ